MAEKNNTQMPDVNEQIKNRMDKLKALQEEGRDPFEITKYDVTNHTQDIKEHFEDFEGKEVSIAGRLMAKRVMGKASFCNVADLKGNIQLYVARDSVGEEPYARFKKFDIGDIVGVKGEVFRTQKGEISVHVSEITLLTKSLQVLPEKFHGLTDTEVRYRQRYVDLIVNPEVRTTFMKRSQIIKEIRNFLDGRNFMEVETPMLVSNAGGAAARPFETHYNALDEDVKLRISLELYLKRLIVGGMERVYEIGRVFRNEGVDTRHNPEFTLMELYQAYTDYNGMMELAETMYRTVCEKVNGSPVVKYGDIEIDFSKPFEKITMVDAVKKYANVDFSKIETLEEARAVAKEHNIEFEERHKKGDILNLFFEEYVEEHLIQPTFVMDHPVDISPLLSELSATLTSSSDVKQKELLKQEIVEMGAFALSGEVVERQFYIKIWDRVSDGVERDLLQKLKLLGGYFSDSGIQTEILEQQDIVRLCNLVNNPAYVHLEDSGINAAIPILESVGVA